tara:strand:- start:12633 stop:12938 length:306 start_codon:yes stop_codon:yes gene_type:complete
MTNETRFIYCFSYRITSEPSIKIKEKSPAPLAKWSQEKNRTKILDFFISKKIYFLKMLSERIPRGLLWGASIYAYSERRKGIFLKLVFSFILKYCKKDESF